MVYEEMNNTFSNIVDETARLNIERNLKAQTVGMIEKNRNIVKNRSRELESKVQNLEENANTRSTLNRVTYKQHTELLNKSKELEQKLKEADLELKNLEDDLAENAASFSSQLRKENIETLNILSNSYNQALQVSMVATVKASRCQPVVGDGRAMQDEEGDGAPNQAEDMVPSKLVCSSQF